MTDFFKTLENSDVACERESAGRENSDVAYERNSAGLENSEVAYVRESAGLRQIVLRNRIRFAYARPSVPCSSGV